MTLFGEGGDVSCRCERTPPLHRALKNPLAAPRDRGELEIQHLAARRHATLEDLALDLQRAVDSPVALGRLELEFCPLKVLELRRDVKRARPRIEPSVLEQRVRKAGNLNRGEDLLRHWRHELCPPERGLEAPLSVEGADEKLAACARTATSRRH